jgi:hypothetical protein
MTARPVILAAALAMLVVAAPPRDGAAVEPPWVAAREAMMTPLGVTAGELDGAKLHGEGGEVVGEIEQVLATRDGLVAGLAVEIDAGVLGIGERHVILRFDQVHRDGDRIATRLSRAQLEAQPRWDD